MSVSQHHPLARNTSEGVLRLLFGVFLAVIAIVLAFGNPHVFAAAMVIVSLFAAREWHRLVRSPAQAARAELRPIHVQTAVTAGVIAIAAALLLLRLPLGAFALLAVGAVVAFVLAARRDDHPFWHAAGVLYIGLPVLALVALQALAPQGPKIVLGLFLIVWATDTGALVFGKLIGGARLAPRLSPGKTWAGTIGGSLTGAVVFALYIVLFSFNGLYAFLFALVLSAVAHGGDLFESFVKRRFGTKDSGGLIPGHGGVLDRMDSMFATSVVMALLVFVFNFNPLFGGRW